MASVPWPVPAPHRTRCGSPIKTGSIGAPLPDGSIESWRSRTGDGGELRFRTARVRAGFCILKPEGFDRLRKAGVASEWWMANCGKGKQDRKDGLREACGPWRTSPSRTYPWQARGDVAVPVPNLLQTLREAQLVDCFKMRWPGLGNPSLGAPLLHARQIRTDQHWTCTDCTERTRGPVRAAYIGPAGRRCQFRTRSHWWTANAPAGKRAGPGRSGNVGQGADARRSRPGRRRVPQFGRAGAAGARTGTMSR